MARPPPFLEVFVTRFRIAIGAGVVVATAAVSLFGSLLADSPSAGPVKTTSPAVAGRLIEGFSPGDTEAYVRFLERQVAGGSPGARPLTLLGLAYQQRARETGDPGFYPR